MEACQRRLLASCNLPGVSAEGSTEERLVQVSSILPLDSVNMVSRDLLFSLLSSFSLLSVFLSFLSLSLSLSLSLQVRSVGVLLKYIEKKRFGVELEDESVRTPILAIKHFSL